MHARILIVTAPSLCLLAACFDPKYPAGNPCAPDGWCPAQQRCVEGICRRPSFSPRPPDAGPDASARDDADLALLLPSAGALFPEFDPEVTAYTLNVSDLISAVRWTVRPSHPEATVRVAGEEVSAGVPSPGTPVDGDSAEISIEVAAPAGNRKTYVVTASRDASIEQALYAKASNTGAGDLFGWSVAVSDDTLVVGAPYEASSAAGVDGNQNSDGAPRSGAVYVFRLGAAGWAQEAYLKAEAPDVDDELGLSVAIDGDILAVGAYGDDSGVPGDPSDNSVSDAGAVYIFRRAGATWTQEAYLKAPDIDADDEFGLRVALDGDTLAVGVPYDDSGARGVDGESDDEGAPDSGAVYVFRRSGTTWAREAYLKASNTGQDDRFGYSVALSGDLLVAGARFEDSGATGVDGDQSDEGAPDSGAVYVFRRSGTTWAQEAYLKASNTGQGDQLGYFAAVSGSLVAVSAIGEDAGATGVDGDGQNNLAPGSGAVYVFGHDGETWAQRGYLKATNAEAGDSFGRSLAAYGELVAVGASGESGGSTGVNGEEGDNSTDDSGAVYVYGCPAACDPVAYLKASNTGAGDQLGRGVALDADALVVGAPFEASGATGVDGDQSSDARAESGAVYLFR